MLKDCVERAQTCKSMFGDDAKKAVLGIKLHMWLLGLRSRCDCTLIRRRRQMGVNVTFEVDEYRK